jgi:hypothetical protein
LGNPFQVDAVQSSSTETVAWRTRRRDRRSSANGFMPISFARAEPKRLDDGDLDYIDDWSP